MKSSIFRALVRRWNLFIVNSVAGSRWTPGSLRRRLLLMGGVEFNDQQRPAFFFEGCEIYGTGLRIGAGTFINIGCKFHVDAPIEIGANCAVAMEVLFCTATHEVGAENQRAGALLFLPIRVGDGCWIGVRATILPGVTIGEGCIIAAGAIVAKDCAPNGLYGGVPARRLRDL